MSTKVVLHICIQLLTTRSTLTKSFPSPTLLWKWDTGVYFRIRVVSAVVEGGEASCSKSF